LERTGADLASVRFCSAQRQPTKDQEFQAFCQLLGEKDRFRALAMAIQLDKRYTKVNK
jgi:hypothetical protein